MIGVGFIGVGGMGLGQARAFAQAQGCAVVAASDVSDVSRANFAKEFPGVATYTDYKDLLANRKVDAVVIATPTLLHRDVAIDAMKAGRAVLSEKPLARTVADCQKMIAASERTGRFLMVAQCRRFDTDWGTLATLVGDGSIGSPVLWRHMSAGKFSLYSKSTWFVDERLGGGPLIDGAVHNYDFANLIWGDPESVIASSIKLDPACSAIDTGSAVVRYGNGNQLLLSWTWAVGGGSLFDFLGTKGAIQAGPGELASASLDTSKFGYYRVTDVEGRNPRLVPFARTDMYVKQAQHFIDCMNDSAKVCLSPATEAIKAVAVAEAILKAAPKGRDVKVKW